MSHNPTNISAEQPLHGAQVCCTSVAPEVRSQLAEWIEAMGGEHSLDLTSDVTHLVVGDTNSEKYQYVAREREDVKVVLPRFIEAVRTAWMNNTPFDLNALETHYRCPTLHGLKMCITGFEDLEFRAELAGNIFKNGGRYTGDLTKDVTHLVAFTPQGNKYEHARMWQLKIVSLKWYKDTLDRGMQLDESLYHPTIPPERQGMGAWNRIAPTSARLGKRQREEQTVQEQTRKLRRTASARFGSQQDNMWNDIVRPNTTRSLDPADPRQARARTAAHIAQPDVTMDVGISNGEYPDAPQQEPPPPYHAPLRETVAVPKSTGILSGKNFVIKGFDERRKTILQEHLSSHGAIVHSTIVSMVRTATSDTDTAPCFLVVPHEIENTQLGRVEQNRANVTIVTELWVEQCMSSRAYVPPEEYVLGMPARTISVPAVSNLVINATGFPQVQTMHISKVVKKLGATYDENFKQETSVLVCNSASVNQRKLQHAAAWNVPVVTEKWLWQFLRTSRIPSFEPFLVSYSGSVTSRKSPLTRSVPHADHTTSEPAPVRNPLPDRPHVNAGHVSSSNETATATINRQAQRSGGAIVDEQEDLEEIPSKAVSNMEGDVYDPPNGTSNGGARLPARPIPLQGISTNISPRKSSALKKSLFRTYDGTGTDRTETHILDNNNNEQESEANMSMHINNNTSQASDVSLVQTEEQRHSNLVRDFLEVKAAAEAKKQQEALSKKPTNNKSRKLQGRAHSNLSNSSKLSNDNKDMTGPKQAFSRASSINSLNTDGLGVPFASMSKTSSNLLQESRDSHLLEGNANLNRTETGRLQLQTHASIPSARGMTDFDFHAALTALSTSQPPRPPSPTPPPQLSYAESAEASRIKAILAEKRRTRTKMGQKQADPEPELSREDSEEKRQRLWREERTKAAERVVGDDINIVGMGRRTRGREKVLSALVGNREEDLGLTSGDVF